MGSLDTFTHPEGRPDAAVAALTRMGFGFGPARPEIRTWLDTFDGRLQRAGLRLVLSEPEGPEVTLSGDDAVPARIILSSALNFVTDLPPGPLRARLAAVVDVRALLPRVVVEARSSRGALLDRTAKTVVTATLREELRVDTAEAPDLPSWTIEIEGLTGFEKRAGKARTVLRELGLVRLGGDTLALAAAAAGVDLAGYSNSPTIALDPDMSTFDGVRAVLANLADTIDANWQGTIDRIDPEFLHDLRVAVRRSRSVLREARDFLPAEVVGPAREQLARLSALTGPARDLDVYLIDWDSYTAPLALDAVGSLAPVRALLEERREAAYAELGDVLRSNEARGLLASWRGWLRDPAVDRPETREANGPLGGFVARRITRAQTRLIERARAVRPETPAVKVHELRKDAKKVRYLIECFGSLLVPARRRSFVKQLKGFQDILGAHQDAEVQAAELRMLSHELHGHGAAPPTMLAIGQFIELLERRRVAAREAFAQGFAEYDTKATRRDLDAALARITP